MPIATIALSICSFSFRCDSSLRVPRPRLAAVTYLAGLSPSGGEFWRGSSVRTSAVPVGPPGFHTTTREPKRAHLSVPVFKNTTRIPRKDPQEREERMKFPVGESKKSAKFWPPTLRAPTLLSSTLRGSTLRGSTLRGSPFGPPTPSGPTFSGFSGPPPPAGPHPCGPPLLWAPHPSAPPLRATTPPGPHPSGPPLLRDPTLRAPTPPGPHPFGPPPKTKLAKCGLAKFGQQKLAKFCQIRMAKCGQLTLAKFGFGQIRFGQMRPRPETLLRSSLVACFFLWSSRKAHHGNESSLRLVPRDWCVLCGIHNVEK